MNPIGIIILSLLIIVFLLILRNYFIGLKDSPREIWLLFSAKLIEYAAYGSSNMAFVLYLSSDCGLGDIQAGSYIGIWSMVMTSASIFVGSVVDSIGIRKTLLLGILTLICGRIIMPFSRDLTIVTFFSFFPIAVGNAILGPVLSVGIKKYTSGASTSLGFGLFYTMMNIGFALGGYIFDKVRNILGETSTTILPILNLSLSTYQIIFLFSFILTIPSLFLVIFIRENPFNENDHKNSENIEEPILNFRVSILIENIRNSSSTTFSIMKEVFFEKSFWIYLFTLGILVFIKLVFYHFHYTFPKYGIRVLGEGAKVGNLYGIVNPVIIIFLVPVVSHFTKSIKSYYMLLIGTSISVLSIFLCTIKSEHLQWIVDTTLGQFILSDWLELNIEKQNPLLFGILAFVIIFSIGESIWSPRLLQLSAEIAPQGREGTYIALSYLPYFLAKLIAGPLSGWLLATYTPASASTYPDHYLIWIWIGCMSAFSPLGLLLFRKFYIKN